MRHIIVFVIVVGIAHGDPLLHVQQYHAGVPLVRYESPVIPVYSAASSHSHVVNHPYVGAYHAAPVYSRQVYGAPQYFGQLRAAPIQTSGQYVIQQQYQPQSSVYHQQGSQQFGYRTANYENPPVPQTNAQGVANQNVNTNTNENAVKTKTYEIRRPAIKKEFYDIEEKVIVRPAGSALIELDPPFSKTLKNTDDRQEQQSQQQQQQRGQFDQSNQQNQQQDQGNQYRTSQQHYAASDGYGYEDHNPNQYGQHVQPPPFIYTHLPPHGPPLPVGPPPPPHPPVYPVNPRPVSDCDDAPQPPSRPRPRPTPRPIPQQPPTYIPPQQQPQPPQDTYLPPWRPDEQQPTNPGRPPHKHHGHRHHHNIVISSSTPVTIIEDDYAPDSAVDGTRNSNQQDNSSETDIVYAGANPSNSGNDDTTFESNDEPDAFLHEVQSRGDAQSGRYRIEQPDQFFHELPRSRLRAPYQAPLIHVETRSHGSPRIYSEDIKQLPDNQPENKQNATKANDKQQQLIDLYTGSGSVTEVARVQDVTPQPPRPSAAYTASESNSNSANNCNGDHCENTFHDAGKVRARVIQVTPAPSNAVPQETSNTRRVVVSKHVTTVQEVEVPDTNSTQANNNTVNVNRTNNNSNFNNQGGYSTPGQFASSDQYPSSTPSYSSVEYNSGEQQQFSSSTPDYNQVSSSTTEQNVASLSPFDVRSGRYITIITDSSEDNSPSQSNEQNSNPASGRYTSGTRVGNNANQQFASNAQDSNASSGRYTSGVGNNANQQFASNAQDSNASSGRYTSGVGNNGNQQAGRPSANRRVIYVRPVSQEFAELRATPPRNRA